MDSRIAKLKQATLVADPRPDKMQVNGTELMTWGERARAEEIHIYRMDVVQNGKYVIHLIWLDGRKMWQEGQQPESVAPPEKPQMKTEPKIKLARQMELI